MERDAEFNDLFCTQANPNCAPNRNSGCFGDDDDIREAPAVTYSQNEGVDEFIQKVFGVAHPDSSTLHKSSAPNKIRFERISVAGKSMLSAYNHRGELVTQLDVHKMLTTALKERAESSCEEFFGV